MALTSAARGAGFQCGKIVYPFETHDQAIAAPEFNVASINELPGMFERCVISLTLSAVFQGDFHSSLRGTQLAREPTANIGRMLKAGR